MCRLEKNIKIIISLFLIMILLFIIPFATSATSPEEYLKYYEDYDGTIAINGLNNSNLTSIQIPEEIEGKKVTYISNYAFEDCINLVEIKLPKTIKTIGYHAFINCINLETINLPNGLKTIGGGAFYGCSNLSRITIPESVNNIYYNNTFGNCDPNLTLVVEKGSYAETYAKDSGYNYEYVMYPISSAIIKIPTNKTYTGSSIKPALTIQNKNKTKVLKEGENYKLFYGKNVNAGIGTIRIEGIENYTGVRTIQFNIAQQDLTKLIVPEIEDCVYTGKEIKPNVKIVHGKRVLGVGTDYTIQYKNNKNIGTATVTITGKGNYKGKVERNFDILKRNISEKGSISKVGNVTYTGNKIKPEVTVKYNKTKLDKKKDYTVTYKNNKNVGVATIVIRGKGVYEGEIVKTFKILPKKTKITKIKATQAGFNLNWKKKDGITGYEVQYATKSNFKNAETVRYSSKKTSVSFDNLQGEKKYYVRMRTYKNTKGEYYYSDWTSTREIKTKRKEIKINKKYISRYYGSYYTNGYADEVLKFKKGNKLELTILSGMEGATYKGTYKQKGDKITAKLECYEYGYCQRLSVTITILDSKNVYVYYDDWGGAEYYSIL